MKLSVHATWPISEYSKVWNRIEAAFSQWYGRIQGEETWTADQLRSPSLMGSRGHHPPHFPAIACVHLFGLDILAPKVVSSEGN